MSICGAAGPTPPEVVSALAPGPMPACEPSITIDAMRTLHYVLGSDEPELARLDAQADAYASSTRLLLRAAGIGPGMRVLDLGTGLGHVAFELARLVGEAGEVVGIDQSPGPLATAEERRCAAGIDTVRFVEADVSFYRDDTPFDAVVERLLLCHVADPLAVLRHHVAGLSAGGRVVALDFDMVACRSEPRVELAESRRDWVIEAFRRAGTNPTLGPRLPWLLREAGLAEVESLGVQRYDVPGDPAAAAMLGGVTRSLAPQIVATGIAGEAELDLDGYERRLTRALMEAESVFLPPTLAGAWGVRR